MSRCLATVLLLCIVLPIGCDLPDVSNVKSASQQSDQAAIEESGTSSDALDENQTDSAPSYTHDYTHDYGDTADRTQASEPRTTQSAASNESRNESSPASTTSASSSTRTAPSSTSSSSPSPSSPSSSQSQSQSRSPSIRFDLSAGVALAQTGPEGTFMSFSVDYRLVEGQMSSGAVYALVITPQRGQPLVQPIQFGRMGPRGNIPIMAMQWRPEIGPFEAHIIDRQGNRLSNREPLHRTGGY